MDHLDDAWAWFRSTFDRIGDGVTTTDVEGRIRHMNLAQSGFLGDGILFVEKPLPVQVFTRPVREAFDSPARVRGDRPA
jgi:PAS domain-containing protein